MKDISIYFGGFGTKGDYRKDQLGNIIVVNSESNFVHPKKKEIALIFVPEYRNSNIRFQESSITAIREYLYNLYSGDWDSNIYDLGTILPGETIEDTQLAISDVVEVLIKEGVFPLVIGGSQDLTYSIYKAYEKLEQTVNILDIDCGLDLGEPDDTINSNAWINKLILHKPGYLFNYSLLGYQNYLVSKDELALLDKMYFDVYPLSEFYANNRMVEPLVRNADIISFDMDSIRGSDYNANSRSLPHGFYGEDACRVLRYAGLSDKLTSLGIFNFNDNGIKLNNDSNLIAQMIWYFIEGYDKRKNDYPIGSKKNYIKYRVNLDDFKDEIIFYRSDRSSRWWMEVPYPKMKGVKFQRHLLVPCTYEDYERAQQNEMPNLWWRTFQKLS